MQKSSYISAQDISKIIKFECSNPPEILGPKLVGEGSGRGLVIHAYLPRAKQAWVSLSGAKKMPRIEMTLLHAQGFFEVFLPGAEEKHPYRLEFCDESG